MNSKLMISGLAAALLFGGAVHASAALTTIGTATYGGADYNLIWDNDNNGKSIIWLDYTNPSDTTTNWTSHKAWAAGLDGELTYNIDAPYGVTWDNSAWRLPSTVDGEYVRGNDGTTTGGYNITTSEMGHLFYVELENIGRRDTSGDLVDEGWGLQNTGDFNNLVAGVYWSTEYATNPNKAWVFTKRIGMQYVNPHSSNRPFGLAVRDAQVVPVPAPVLLLGAGLLALMGARKRQKGNRI